MESDVTREACICILCCNMSICTVYAITYIYDMYITYVHIYLVYNFE